VLPPAAALFPPLSTSLASTGLETDRWDWRRPVRLAVASVGCLGIAPEGAAVVVVVARLAPVTLDDRIVGGWRAAEGTREGFGWLVDLGFVVVTGVESGDT
jgi:hypothetical protein